MPPGGRFGGNYMLGTPAFPQNQAPHSFNQQQHERLPPPSFNNHAGFAQANTNSALNDYNPMSTLNGLGNAFGSGPAFAGAGGTGLASHNAQAAFAHGGQLQAQQHQREALRRTGGAGKVLNKNRIREVWDHNLSQEMQNLRELVEQYPYISMDTEFPGVVIRPMGQFLNVADYHYQTLRVNVDMLSCIQVGITLFNEDGETPPVSHESSLFQNSTFCPSTWQFNFKFSLQEDMYNQESIDFLQSAGLDMEAHEKMGIDPRDFGSLLITSGLVMLEDVRWISFHSAYDIAYLIKIMYAKPLPDTESEYRKLMTIFFPAIYDIKYMIKTVQASKTVDSTGSPLTGKASQHLASLGGRGGLQDVADELGVRRIGTAHMAGSDSLLTGKVFWEVKQHIFNDAIDDERFLNQVWGIQGLKGSHGGRPTALQVADNPAGTPGVNGTTQYGSPSTPRTATAQNSMTPGGGGGVFGRFAMR